MVCEKAVKDVSLSMLGELAWLPMSSSNDILYVSVCEGAMRVEEYGKGAIKRRAVLRVSFN